MGRRGLGCLRDRGRDGARARALPDDHAQRSARRSQGSTWMPLTEQGDEGNELYLLDGVLAVEVDGETVAEIGPGAILGACGRRGRQAHRRSAPSRRRRSSRSRRTRSSPLRSRSSPERGDAKRVRRGRSGSSRARGRSAFPEALTEPAPARHSSACVQHLVQAVPASRVRAPRTSCGMIGSGCHSSSNCQRG